MNPTAAGSGSNSFLGTSFPVPTDPSYYLGQVGLSSMVPQAFNADTLSALFSPQGMQYTPANAMATNPFFQEFMQSAQGATRLQRKQAPNAVGDANAGAGGQPQTGLNAMAPAY